MSTKFQEEAMKNHGVEFGDRIRGRGKISRAGVGELLVFYFVSIEMRTTRTIWNSLGFPVVMSDKDIEKPREGILVVIEGEFSEDGAGGGAGMFENGEIISQ